MPRGGYMSGLETLLVSFRFESRVFGVQVQQPFNIAVSTIVGRPPRTVIRLELPRAEMTAAKRITLVYFKSKFLLRFRPKENTGTIPPTLLFA